MTSAEHFKASSAFSSSRKYMLSKGVLVTEIDGSGAKSASAFLRNQEGTLFRIGKEEYFLLRGLLAGIDPEALVSACQKRLHLNIVADDIRGFAEQMVGRDILSYTDSNTSGEGEQGVAEGFLGQESFDASETEEEMDAEDGKEQDDDLYAALEALSPLKMESGPLLDRENDDTGATPSDTPSDSGEALTEPSHSDDPELVTDALMQDKLIPENLQLKNSDRDEQELRFPNARPKPPKARDMDIVLFDPTGLLRFLGRAFWLPSLFLSSAAMVPLGILALLSIFNRLDEIGNTLISAISTINLFSILLTSLVTVNLATRLVSGVMIQKYGGEVQRFGLIFMLFLIPRFAIQMTGIVKLDREGRIAVYASALRTRFLIFTICTLFWAMSRQSGTYFPEIMVIVGQIALFSFLLSSFPLLSGEGYQLMCAYFNQPMLRERSFRYILGVKRKGQKAPTSGEVWSFVLYGVGAILTIAFLVTVVTAYVATALEGRFGGTGVMMFFFLLALMVAWIVVMRLRGRQLKKEMLQGVRDEHRKRPANTGAKANFLPVPAASRELTVTGRQLVPAPGKSISIPGPIPSVYGNQSKRSAWRRWVRRGIVASFLVVAAIVALMPYHYETGGDFVILANDRVQVVAWVPSELQDVYVDEGDFVEAGQLLAKQVDTREAYRLEVSKANLAKAKSQLQNLREGATPEEILVAEQQVERQRIELPYLESEMERAKELLERGILPKADAERIIGNFETGKADLRSAEANLARVRAMAQESEVSILQADVNRLEAEVAFHQKNLDETEIVTPVSGRVVFEGDRPVPGKYLDVGALVMEIVGDDIARAEIKIPEADVSLVLPNEKVRLKFWALPGEEQIGAVSSVAPVAEDEQFGKIVRVKTTLPNPDGFFRPGMTGYAKIEGQEMRVWEAYTRLFVRFFLIELWGWIP